MHQHAVSWFHGWKITLKSTGFGCQDGTQRFASSALLQHVPVQSNPATLHWPDAQRNSHIHMEDAFWTYEEAATDALARAQRKILELNAVQDLERNEIMDSDESQAARLEITFDGKRYTYRQYHYDHFEDALRYAAAEHRKPGFMLDEAFQPRWLAAYHPTAGDEEEMRLHGIAYVEGHYLYGGHRYSQLCDAVTFAAGHPNL